KLTIDQLQGYSMEYFQLVKAIPKIVEGIAARVTDNEDIANNAKEEAEHVEPWVRFATAIGVSRYDLVDYAGTTGTNAAVARMLELANASLGAAVAALYDYEMEL